MTVLALRLSYVPEHLHSDHALPPRLLLDKPEKFSFSSPQVG